MLYLVTGANGSGKTLLTLKHVKERADKEARPVCYNGRFERNPDGPLASWKKIDIKDWQAEPDGTIFFVDECHNDFPKRGTNEAVPEYVRMLAEHRKRGCDFYLISQHPMNVDAFVRRLIGNPGWHRHLKRVAGAQLVSQLQWDAVNTSCERPGSGDSGQVHMVAYPKEVFSWYRSAQLHTGKRSIPRAVWVLLAVVLIVPVLAVVAWRTLFSNRALQAASSDKPAQASSAASAPVAKAGPPPAHKLTVAEYMRDRQPRVEGLPFTAPVYDAVTAPKDAPYPAACVHGRKPGQQTDSCDCFTQQGTRLQTPRDLCVQIASSGYFVDWQAPALSSGAGLAGRAVSAAAPVRAESARSDSDDARGMSVMPYTRPTPEAKAQAETVANDASNIRAMRSGERVLR